MTTTTYLAQVSYETKDIRDGRDVGTFHNQTNLLLVENSESCARQALADWLVSAQIGWADRSTFKSYRILKTIKK
jgi:hypothetical protein